MTQNTKKTLMYGGAILLVSVIAYAIYSSKKTKLYLVDGARVTDDEETTVPEGTTTPKSTRSNYFASLLQNPLPKDIDYTFGSTTKF
jgi:hypothetical protein